MENKRGKKYIYIIIAAVIICIITILLFANRTGNNATKNNAAVECQTDNDCVKQQTGCCSCNMGGAEVCMSKENATKFQAEIAKCDKHMMCIAMYACQQTSCKCISGKCSEAETGTGIANPASVYCEQNNGRLEIKQDSQGNQYGICIFSDGSSCDEWQYYRGECKHGQAPAV